MNELDVFKAMLQVGQGLPAYVGALVAGFLGSWVYLKKIGKAVTKDEAETSTYKLLIDDNKRLSGLVKSMGAELTELKISYALDRENMQKQLFLERETCFREMAELRVKLENLERKVRQYEPLNPT